MKRIENLDIGHVRHGFDKKFIIKIADVSDDRSLETDFPHRHNFYMICLIIKGSGTHVIDFEKTEIRADRLFFLKPEQVHFWEVKPGSKLAVVQFSAEFMTGLFNFNSIPAISNLSGSCFDLEPDTAATFSDIFRLIGMQDRINDTNSDRIIQAYIFILLSEIDRLIESDSVRHPGSNKYAILEKFKGLINTKYREITSVNEYAGLLNITPNYLNIVCKETSGLTATGLINRRIILEARRLLISSHSDVGQISLELGFKDASYFARFFKKAAGISPSEFRNNIDKLYRHPHE